MSPASSRCLSLLPLRAHTSLISCPFLSTRATTSYIRTASTKSRLSPVPIPTAVSQLRDRQYATELRQRVLKLGRLPPLWRDNPNVQNLRRDMGIELDERPSLYVLTLATASLEDYEKMGVKTRMPQQTNAARKNSSRTDFSKLFSGDLGTLYLPVILTAAEISLPVQREAHHPKLVDWYESDELFGRLQYTFGEAALMSREFFRLGLYMLACAVEAGNIEAAVKLVQINRKHPVTWVDQAQDLVREAAEQGTDWRALCLRSSEIISESDSEASLQRSYDMARQVFNMTQPSKEIDKDVSDDKLSPWRILRKTASITYKKTKLEEDRRVMSEATIAGVYDYDDPEACWFLANNEDLVESHSQKWVELMTKAAMAGKPDYNPQLPGTYQKTAADALAKYYFELYNWFPCTMEPSKDPNSRMGFEWLEVAAHTHVGKPLQFYNAYLAMASVLRGNNLVDEGLKVLNECEMFLKEMAVGKENETERSEALDGVTGYIKHWATLSPGSNIRAEYFLEEPVGKVLKNM